MALYHECGDKTVSTFALQFFMLISDGLGGVLYLSCRQKLSSLLGNKVNFVLATIDERKIDKKIIVCNTLLLFWKKVLFIQI
jgi:hypothetical protein